MTDTSSYQYFDNQDTFSPDINDLFNRFISVIDQTRSHYNGLSLGLNETATPQYQESRCHTFFRMLGLPVVSKSPAKYYSPGYDPNLNLDSELQNTNQIIAANAIQNTGFTTSQRIRETQYQTYINVFNSGGINAIAIALGSIHLRAFDTALTSSVLPLDFDKGQIQNINARVQDITSYFSSSTANFASQLGNIDMSLLTSTHIIKPFVVDPRIDSTIMPNINRIAAPFLLDRSQLKIAVFDGQLGSTSVIQRPYIEYVLSIIFSSTNAEQLASQPYVQSIINSIQDIGTKDQDLINIVNNKKLTQTSIVIFSKYLKIIRALVNLLHTSIIDIERVRTNINWQPVPSPSNGIEAGSRRGSIADVVPGDPNNRLIEKNIISAQVKQILDEFALGVGNNGVSDPGDFVFSNVDDLVFNAAQTSKTSFQDMINNLTKKRNQFGNDGLDALKNIEIITGEFGGLGLLDILAIQGAMWIVDPSVLLSLIDTAAYKRMQQRTDLSITGSQSTDIMATLTKFEAAVSQMYKLIAGYIKILNTQGNYGDIQP